MNEKSKEELLQDIEKLNKEVESSKMMEKYYREKYETLKVKVDIISNLILKI